MSRTTIVMEDDLQEQAKQYGVNVSEVCREAVAAAVEARERALVAGDEYSMVKAEIWHDSFGENREVVQFLGRLVLSEDYNECDYYLTSSGRAAVVDAERRLQHADDIAALGVATWVEQAFQVVVGEVVQPTFLDI